MRDGRPEAGGEPVAALAGRLARGGVLVVGSGDPAVRTALEAALGGVEVVRRAHLHVVRR